MLESPEAYDRRWSSIGACGRFSRGKGTCLVVSLELPAGKTERTLWTLLELCSFWRTWSRTPAVWIVSQETLWNIWLVCRRSLVCNQSPHSLCFEGQFARCFEEWGSEEPVILAWGVWAGQSPGQGVFCFITVTVSGSETENVLLVVTGVQLRGWNLQKKAQQGEPGAVFPCNPNPSEQSRGDL